MEQNNDYKTLEEKIDDEIDYLAEILVETFLEQGKKRRTRLLRKRIT